jgi:hypothetical protein
MGMTIMAMPQFVNPLPVAELAHCPPSQLAHGRPDVGRACLNPHKQNTLKTLYTINLY